MRRGRHTTDTMLWRRTAVAVVNVVYAAITSTCHRRRERLSWRAKTSVAPRVSFFAFHFYTDKEVAQKVHFSCWRFERSCRPINSNIYALFFSGTCLVGSATWVSSFTCSRWVTTYVGKPSDIGHPTRPTQPFILSGSINEQHVPNRYLPSHLEVVHLLNACKTKGRHDGNLQVKLCDPCLSALCVSWHGAI